MAQRGVTLLEIIIVLAIMSAIIVTVTSWGDPDYLGDSTNEVSLVIAEGQLRALETGNHHRVVIDLDEGVVEVEECQSPPSFGSKYQRSIKDRKVRKRENTEDEAQSTEEVLQNKNIPAAFMMGLEPEKAAKAAEVLAGKDSGPNMQCGLALNNRNFSLGMRGGDKKEKQSEADGGGGQAIRYKLPEQVKFSAVYTRGETALVKDGQARLHIFPLGSMQRGIVELALKEDETEIMMVTSHGLNGKVEWQRKHDNPEDFVQLDPSGEREDER